MEEKACTNNLPVFQVIFHFGLFEHLCSQIVNKTQELSERATPVTSNLETLSTLVIKRAPFPLHDDSQFCDGLSVDLFVFCCWCSN